MSAFTSDVDEALRAYHDLQRNQTPWTWARISLRGGSGDLLRHLQGLGGGGSLGQVRTSYEPMDGKTVIEYYGPKLEPLPARVLNDLTSPGFKVTSLDEFP